MNRPFWILDLFLKVINAELIPLADPKVTLLIVIARNSRYLWVLPVIELCQGDGLYSLQNVAFMLSIELVQGKWLDVIGCRLWCLWSLRYFLLPIEKFENSTFHIIWRVLRNRAIARGVIVSGRGSSSRTAQGHQPTVELATKLSSNVLTLIAWGPVHLWCPLECQISMMVHWICFNLPIAEHASLFKHFVAGFLYQLLSVA